MKKIHNALANAMPVLLCLVFCIAAFTGLCPRAWAKPVPAKPGSEEVLISREEFKGDFDQMVKRRLIRVLVTYSKTNYFLDGARPRGATYDLLKAFEKELNKKLREKGKTKKHLAVHVIAIPVPRDELISDLLNGKGDIAAANLTITKTRLKQVDFADPLGQEVKEIVVTGPVSPAIKTLDDLSGQEVVVRKSSSYYTSLLRFNEKLKKQGKKPCNINLADEYLETEDILEMVNAGIIPITIADNHLAKFWKSVFSAIKPHYELTVRTGGKIAWAMRKNTPQLKKEVNQFIKTAKKGTLLGNILFKRYLKSNKWVKNPLAVKARKRYEQTIGLFEKYSGKYGFDWLMIAALAYQESGIDQSKRSPAGAVGVMQILPTTASSPPVNIPEITIIDKNIHAGVKYLDYLHRTYFSDKSLDPLNQVLFTFASYNAGPARVRQLRERAKKMGLNPNLWFQNVERVAAKVIGRETVQYVSNIYKYYLAYSRIQEKQARKSKAKETMTPSGQKK
ncbi:lytic transglycosylase F [Dethiosulfatarculus sandiegensis]|uniref:Solute-binding protein family 3/N-terminal domain-containing protein n=1 Tax=Dethiosulfatarculus sandiegensis TaxID=1429043 RepID=A0A0D2JYV4_9BACT|nr:lytic transglycosylase F [Dethiosulfatarculus sandiegensis]KIX14740.1 hypothetical protein X474_06255 [Dethiosulfatarculus sandiegensis]